MSHENVHVALHGVTSSHALLSPPRFAPDSLDEDEDDGERTRVFERPVIDATVVAPRVHHRFVFLPLTAHAYEAARADVPPEAPAKARTERSARRRLGYAMLCGSLFGLLGAAGVLTWLGH